MSDDRAAGPGQAQPRWTGPEAVRLVGLYLEHRDDLPTSADDDRIRTLSAELRALAGRESEDDVFRNPSGIFMQLMALRQLDPNRAQGGWRPAGGMIRQVWEGRHEHLERRREMWARLLAADGPDDVTPADIAAAQIRPSNTGQGVFRDHQVTEAVAPPHGVAQTFLALGKRYADAIDEQGGRYYYPRTDRGARDESEVESIRNADRLRLPVFVILPGTNSRLRSVRLGTIASRDDEQGFVQIVFSDAVLDTPQRSESKSDTRPGVAYRRASGATETERQPFMVDPKAQERATVAHMDAQNRIAELLEAEGIEPLSPGPGDPQFDLAFELNGEFWVVEVKSTTTANAEIQLRLGLGQVLRYRSQLGEALRIPVRAVLATSGPFAEVGWQNTCESVGVHVTMGSDFSQLIRLVRAQKVSRVP